MIFWRAGASATLRRRCTMGSRTRKAFRVSHQILPSRGVPTMQGTRRNALRTLFGAAAAIIALRRQVEAQRSPQPMPSPNAPANENIPAGLDSPEIIHPDRAARATLNRTALRTDVEMLYRSAVELRDDVLHTDINATLSLGVVKKAHDIERLAKQIKERAKG